jgi:hypothetical protein
MNTNYISKLCNTIITNSLSYTGKRSASIDSSTNTEKKVKVRCYIQERDRLRMGGSIEPVMLPNQ